MQKRRYVVVWELSVKAAGLPLLILLVWLGGCQEVTGSPEAAEVENILSTGNANGFDVLLAKYGAEHVESIVNKPLLVAIQEPWVANRVRLSEVALHHGAELDATYAGDTALMMAAMWGRKRDVVFLLEMGAHPQIKAEDGKVAADLVPGGLCEGERKNLVDILR